MMCRVILILLFFSSVNLFSQDVETLSYQADTSNILRNWQLYLVKYPRSSPFSVVPVSIDKSRFSADSSLLKEFCGVCWFRKVFKVDSTFRNKHLMMKCAIIGAADIFLNRQRVKTIGVVGDSKDSEILDNTDDEYAGVHLEEGRVYELLILYSNHELKYSYGENGEKLFGVEMSVKQTNAIIELLKKDILNSSIAMSFLVFFATLSFVHLTVFLYDKKEKSNLLYSLFCLLISIFIISILLSKYAEGAELKNTLNLFIILTPLFTFTLMAFMFRSFFALENPKWYRLVLGLACVTFVMLFIHQLSFFVGLLLVIFFGLIESTRTVFIAARAGKDGVSIIGSGLALFVVMVSAIMIALLIGKQIQVEDQFWGTLLLIFLVLSVISIPVSITILLARNIAKTNRSLAAKLIEVEELSAKALQHEKEKQHMLQNQNELLEQQVNERTAEINEQKKIIEEKNKDMIDSIHYARRIQVSLLPTEKYIDRILRRYKLRD